MRQFILHLPLNIALNLIGMLTWSYLVVIDFYLLGSTSVHVLLIPSIRPLEKQRRSQLLMLQLLTLYHTTMIHTQLLQEMCYMFFQWIIISFLLSLSRKREYKFVTLLRYIFHIRNQDIMLLHLLTSIYEFHFLFGAYFLSFTPEYQRHIISNISRVCF